MTTHTTRLTGRLLDRNDVSSLADILNRRDMERRRRSREAPEGVR